MKLSIGMEALLHLLKNYSGNICTLLLNRVGPMKIAYPRLSSGSPFVTISAF